jgi:hypothetical protein
MGQRSWLSCASAGGGRRPPAMNAWAPWRASASSAMAQDAPIVLANLTRCAGPAPLSKRQALLMTSRFGSIPQSGRLDHPETAAGGRSCQARSSNVTNPRMSEPSSETSRATRRRRHWTLIWTLIDPVSCISCVSWRYSVYEAETHETFHWESGMRYQSRPRRPDRSLDWAFCLRRRGWGSP